MLKKHSREADVEVVRAMEAESEKAVAGSKRWRPSQRRLSLVRDCAGKTSSQVSRAVDSNVALMR